MDSCRPSDDIYHTRPRDIAIATTTTRARDGKVLRWCTNPVSSVVLWGRRRRRTTTDCDLNNCHGKEIKVSVVVSGWISCWRVSTGAQVSEGGRLLSSPGEKCEVVKGRKEEDLCWECVSSFDFEYYRKYCFLIV